MHDGKQTGCDKDGNRPRKALCGIHPALYSRQAAVWTARHQADSCSTHLLAHQLSLFHYAAIPAQVKWPKSSVCKGKSPTTLHCNKQIKLIAMKPSTSHYSYIPKTLYTDIHTVQNKLIANFKFKRPCISMCTHRHMLCLQTIKSRQETFSGSDRIWNLERQATIALRDNSHWVSGRSVDLYALRGTTHTSIC